MVSGKEIPFSFLPGANPSNWSMNRKMVVTQKTGPACGGPMSTAANVT